MYVGQRENRKGEDPFRGRQVLLFDNLVQADCAINRALLPE